VHRAGRIDPGRDQPAAEFKNRGGTPSFDVERRRAIIVVKLGADRRGFGRIDRVAINRAWR
jgi:hypothetical protein